MVSGIYKIQSIVKSDRIYIGSGVNMASRKRQHFSDLRLNKHHNAKMQHHVNKYGLSDLMFSIIAVCDKEELRPINGIIRPEQFFIWAYSPWFNISPMAGSNMGSKKKPEQIRRGWHHTEETKTKMRRRIRSAESRKKQSEARKGIKITPFTQEHKDKIGNSNKGKKRTPEMIAAFSTMMTGRKQTQAEIDKRRMSNAGKKRTDETKRKMSEAQLNLPADVKLKMHVAQRVIPKEVVCEIKKRWCNKKDTGETDIIIANIFNVSINSVRNIGYGRTYKD